MKRPIWIKQMLVIIAVFSLFLGLAVSAAETVYTPSYVKKTTAPTGTVKPDPSKSYLDQNFSSSWTVSSSTVRTSRQKLNGTTILQLNFRDTFSDNALQLIYPEPENAENYTTLTIPLNIEAENASGYCRVTIECPLSDNLKTISTQAMVPLNAWHEIRMDITEASSIESITVTFSFDTVDVPEKIRISPLFFHNDTQKNYISRYNTSLFKITGGRLTETGGLISVHPYGNSTDLDGDIVLSELPAEGTQAFMLVTLSGNIEGGTLSMGSRSAKNNLITYAECGALPMQNGRAVYSFPFTASDAMVSYRLSFRNSVYSGNGICIESIDILFTTDLPPQATGNGYVSAITVNPENGRLTIQGSVSQKITNTYKKDELVVYAVPYTAESKIENGQPVYDGTELHRSQLYMNFELILDAELTARYAGTHMFCVTVEGADHSPLLISMPRGAEYGSPTSSSHSIVGIEGGSVVGTFESNASHVIVDVPFDRLVTQTVPPDRQASHLPYSNTVKTYGSDGTAVYLDAALMGELLTEIGFYHSANLDVYLRITDKNTNFLTNISTLNAWDMEIYSAILRTFLTYDSALMQDAVSGIILGNAVSYSADSFPEDTPLAIYAYTAKLSALINVTFNTVNATLEPSHTSIIIPYNANGSYNHIVNQMVAWHNKRMGSPTWYVMYCLYSEDKQEEETFHALLSDAKRLFDASSHFGVNGEAKGILYFYTPNEASSAESITAEYDTLCEEVLSQNPTAVFLSVRWILDERKEQLYRNLKNLRDWGKNSTIVTLDAEYTSDSAEPEEKNDYRYTVWDFTNLYHNDGWVSGGTVIGCSTERSEIFSQSAGISCRALRTRVYSDYEISKASAIVLRNFNQSMDFSGIDQLVFRFSVAETAEASTLIFVIGNERIRAEYPLNDVEPGTVHTVQCPISDFEGKTNVDYIGVMVYSGESAVLEIQSVTLRSREMPSEAMAALFTPPAELPPERGLEVYFTVGILFVVTVFAAILIIRRDKEETEQRKLSAHTPNLSGSKNTRRPYYHQR